MQRQNLISLEEKLDFLEDNLLSCHAYSAEYVQTFKKSFSYFKAQLKEKWTKARRKEDAFLKANQSRLNGAIEIPNKSHFRPGRPLKSFEKCSERSKRRKTEEVRSMVEDTVIIHAAQSTLIAKGQRDGSRILIEIAESASRAAKYKSAYKESTSPGRGNILTPHAALAMFVEADLTREQYEIIRNTNPYLYPCYDRLLEAKKECYQTQIRVTSSYAETDLQSLIDNTIMRLSMYLEEELLTLSENERNSLTIICKWGCDGSQQAKYKQKIEDTSGSDANIFLSSFVPRQITCGNENRKIVWQNPSPSSPRLCRPIRFRFIKESIDVTKEEINFVESSVNNLVTSEIELQGNKFVFMLHMTKGNYGNTNDGNTSRRFFKNPKLAADIIGVDYNFIYRLKIILEAISSGYEIDSATTVRGGSRGAQQALPDVSRK
ncbi:uncharacterized protein LOC128858515 [Anastrepha ludens]|uniref:uncharacterized protein LOC128858515 n=1 Tax=Anastrepha ludens TaxID=28586 RepID=UPI0023B1ABCE|nr:uncharacterized protein LOC128858515 [Anastrepha ludens]